MRSVQLQAALTEFVEAAANHLHAEVAAGAEVRFELEPQRTRRGSGGPALYCYRALTGEFIAERQPELERLPSHGGAARLLEGFDGLDRYLASMGADPMRADVRTRVRAAIKALLRDVFEEQTDFDLRPERLRAALERLEQSALAGSGETTLVATLHGLTISSAELALTSGLTIAQPQVLEGLPDGALAAGESGENDHLIVALAAGEDDPAGGDRPRPRGPEGSAARAEAVRRRPRDARRAGVGSRRARQLERACAGRRGPPARDAGGDRRAGG